MFALLAVPLLVAGAAVPPVEPGTALVLRIEGRDAYFDLGRLQGAAPGVSIRVYRVISAVSPRTGAAVQDRFLLGTAVIAEAGEVLSRAQPEGELARGIQVGDVVELARPPPVWTSTPQGASRAPAGSPPPRGAGVPEPPPAPSPAPPPEPTAEQREALEFREAFARVRDMNAPQRLAYWERWAREHPTSPLVAEVRSEVEALRTVRVAAPAPAGAPESGPPPARPPEVAAPTLAFTGNPIEILLRTEAPRPRAALLNWRAPGEALFRSTRFEPAGEQQWLVRLPDEAARPPGVEWYVGAVGEKGQEEAVVASAARPRLLTVEDPPGAGQPRRSERSLARVWVDYADWNRFKGNDYFFNIEGEFLYRVLSGLHSIRMGFGLYQGRGQSLQSALADELAQRPYASRRVGYHYGFTELEYHPTEMVGVIGKLLTGVDSSGFGAGFEGRLRIGYESGTNLLLASGFTKGVGNKNEITLTWDRVQGWPMAGSVVVTNEPVQADYGVRFLYTIGRTVAPFLDVSARLSYQLRDINHNGFGVGLSNSFHW